MSKFSYQVTPQPDLAGFQVVYSEEEISACVTVTLTSLGMREEAQQEEEAKGFRYSNDRVVSFPLCLLYSFITGFVFPK